MPVVFSELHAKVVLPAKRKATRKGFMMSVVIDFGTPRHPDHWYANVYPMEGMGFGDAQDLCDARAGDTLILSGKIRKFQRGDGYNVVADIETAEFEGIPSRLSPNQLGRLTIF